MIGLVETVGQTTGNGPEKPQNQKEGPPKGPKER